MSETKFKVGDRVRVVSLDDGDGNNQGEYFQIGNIGTVISLGKNDYYVQFDAPYHYMDGRWFCSYKQLELLDSPKPSSEPNAHLIAAAPDLYKSLKDVLETIDREDIKNILDDDISFQCIFYADRALKKARGEA